MFNVLRNVSAAGLAVFVGAMAYAASILPSDFNTQIDDAKTDITTIIGAVMTLVILLLGWRYVRRAAS